MLQKKYKIKAKPAASQTGAKTVCLNISMNNTNQTGDKLLAMVQWVNENFEKCIVNVSDSLQRHNLQSQGLANDNAYKKSLELGNQWLKENKTILDQIQIPYKIVRWEHWLNLGKVKNLKTTLYALYQTSETFRSCVDTDISNWIARQGIETTSKAYQNGLAFLLEEFAVHSYMAQREYNLNNQKMVQAYPARQLYAEHYLRAMYGRLGLEKSIFGRLKVETRLALK